MLACAAKNQQRENILPENLPVGAEKACAYLYLRVSLELSAAQTNRSQKMCLAEFQAIAAAAAQAGESVPAPSFAAPVAAVL